MRVPYQSQKSPSSDALSYLSFALQGRNAAPKGVGRLRQRRAESADLRTAVGVRLNIHLVARQYWTVAMVMLATVSMAPPTFSQQSDATISTVADFAGQSDIAAYPYHGVTVAPDGTIYGVTRAGGIGYSVRPNGVVYKVLPGTTVPVPLATLVSPFGAMPQGPLVRAADGVLYGTTYQGGVLERGTVFSVAPDGTLTTLHDFGLNLPNNPDAGARHPSALIQGPDGALYGTTRQGGSHYGGTVFRITVQGQFSTSHEFSDATVDSQSPDGGAGGWTPTAPLAIGRDGRLYGTTDGGGTNGWGTVYRINLSTGFEKIADFNQLQARPGSLVHASNGHLYGMSSQGGDLGRGSVFAVDISSRSVTNTYSGCFYGNSLHRLVQGSGGYLYGTYDGSGGFCTPSVFRISLSGQFQLLSDAIPTGPLLETGSGVFLGTAAGDRASRGIVFRLVDASGCALPVITRQPASGTVPAGGSVLLSVDVSSETPSSFQWYRGEAGDISTPVPGAVTSAYETGPLVTAASYWVRVTNSCGAADSAGASLVIIQQPGATVRGNISLKGGLLLRGPFIREIVVELLPTDPGRPRYRAIAIDGQYDIPGVIDGLYFVSASVNYQISIGSQGFTCVPDLPAPGFETWPDPGGIATATAFVNAPAVLVRGEAVGANIEFPAPIVFIHGILSNFRKWEGWATSANLAGHLTLPVNYTEELSGGDWIGAAEQVETQISLNFLGWTGSSAAQYPPWTIIAHSQGGLIARVISRAETIAADHAALQASLGDIYMLGTPNLGALSSRVVGGNTAFGGCYEYLSKKSMDAGFNTAYPDFGTKQSRVYAVAGTLCLTCRKPGTNDRLVDVQSVFCERGGCEVPIANRKTAYLSHTEFGTAMSLYVLDRFILPTIAGRHE